MSEENPFNFAKIAQEIKQAVNDELPQTLAKQAQNYFTDSFRKQGFDGQSWQEPQRKIPGTSTYKYMLRKHPSWTRSAILVNTGALRRAVSNSIRIQRGGIIQLVAATPYAGYTNDGTEKMPKRQFFGQTAELTKMQGEKVNNTIARIFKEQSKP